jgi:hypothetical protein
MAPVEIYIAIVINQRFLCVLPSYCPKIPIIDLFYMNVVPLKDKELLWADYVMFRVIRASL